MWVFITRGKEPPIDIVNSFLDRYKRTDGNHYIRMNQGRELARSHAFQELVKNHNYVLKRTAPDSSFKCGIVGRGHRALANMMRSMLRGANLGPEY